MPLWPPIQQNSGGFNATSGNATLGAGTTAGNLLVLVVAAGASGLTAPPTGFTTDSPTPGTNRAWIFHKTAVAGETSWALAISIANNVAWAVYELPPADVTPKDTAPSSYASTTGTSLSTAGAGTNPSSTSYDGLAIAVHAAVNTTTSTVPTWSGHTGGFVEDVGQGQAGASTALGMSVSVNVSTAPAVYACTATSSASLGLGATMVVFAAAGARRAPMFDWMCGFEVGTAAGLGTVAGQSPVDSVGGTPAVVSTSPRSGSYCLELSSSAAAENLLVLSTSINLYGSTSPSSGALRGSVYFPSSLPAADTVLFGMGATPDLVIRYVAASQKIGVKFASTGTEVLSASTVTTNTWYSIDAGITLSLTAAVCNWQLDGVDQTQATGTTAQTGFTTFQIGWTTALTATVRFDDLVLSKTLGQYPIGNIKIYPLLADPAGTATATTTADFQTFTANGTTAAWNAAAALAAVDEWPPTIGASADGVVQSVSSASDFVEVPMQTRAAAANGEAIRAVRWYFPGWAASTTAATIGFRGFDGTTETILWAAADPNFDNSTTVPGWVCRMHRTLGTTSGPRVVTQAQLDALTARFGFGNAAVKVGVHSVLAEVAMRTDTTTQAMFGDSTDPTTVQVNVTRDPDSDGIVGITTTATEHQGADLHYEVNASGTDVVVGVGGSNTAPVGAADHPTTNYVALYPDPEPVTDA